MYFYYPFHSPFALGWSCFFIKVWVTQTFIPEWSGPLIVLPELDCCHFPFTLITWYGSIRRQPNGSLVFQTYFSLYYAMAIFCIPVVPHYTMVYQHPLPLKILISVLNCNHIREPTLENPEPIQKTLPSDCIFPELLLVPKSVSVRVQPEKQNHTFMSFCMNAYGFSARNWLTHLWRLSRQIWNL